MRAIKLCTISACLLLGGLTSMGAAAETPGQRLPLLRSRDVASTNTEESKPALWQPSTLRKFGSAGVVMVGVLSLWIALQRGSSRKTGGHPLLESLGSVQVAPKVQLHVVRLGKRLLLLHITGAGHVERIAEITDPEEVGQFVDSSSERVAVGSRRVDELLRELGQADLSRSSLA